MIKRLFLIFISCLIVGFAISWQNNHGEIKVAQTEPPALLYASIKDIQNIDPSIILTEELPVTEPVEPVIIKPVKSPLAKKDPNIITAEAYMVANLETGERYVTYNTTKVFPIASLSKLFTAVVALHNISSTTDILIDQTALDAFGEAGHLVKDERYKINEILYPLLLESSNDAALAIAGSYGYDNFIKSMNSFASSTAMKSTHFKDASGLDKENISNVDDLFILAQYLYKDEKELLNITKQKTYDLATTTLHGSHHFISINPFTLYEPFIGGKTGRTTEAKESMVTLLNYKVSTTTYPIAIVLLRSKLGEREVDTEKILGIFEKTLKMK